jgi:hypothetical protein
MARDAGGGDRRFRFAQVEVPWALGPDPGRYLVRGAEEGSEPTHVLVLATLGAPQRRLLRGRRARDAAPEPPPAPVSTTRATVVETAGVGEDEARAWLQGLDGDGQLDALREAVAVLNVALAAHRVAAADPHVREVGLEGALVARVGYGRGEQVADGRWTEALEVPAAPRRRRRRAMALRPQERLAALLGGRDRPLACEELTLRARLDLDAGRTREAALQLRVALEAAIAELDRSAGRAADMDQRVGELRAARAGVGEAANAALTGDLPPAAVEAVEQALGRLEAALRARAAGGFS